MIEKDIDIVKKIKNENLEDNLLITLSTIGSEPNNKYAELEIFTHSKNWQFVAIMPRLANLFSTILNHKYPENYIDVERDFIYQTEESKIVKGPNYVFYNIDHNLYNHLKQYFDKYESDKCIVHQSSSYRPRRDDYETTTIRRYNFQMINIKKFYLDLHKTYVDEISKIEKFDDLIV
jgi:hypothetical protein